MQQKQQKNHFLSDSLMLRKLRFKGVCFVVFKNNP